MSLLKIFSEDDVHTIVRLLGEVAGMNEPPARRRTALIGAVAGMVKADVWVWGAVRGMRENAPMPLYLHEGGDLKEAERQAFIRYSTVPQFWGVVMEQFGPPRHRAMLFDRAAVADEHLGFINEAFEATGLGHLMYCMYPVSEEVTSLMAIHRRAGRPAYTERERAIVQLIFGQIPWLHYAGTDVPANSTEIDGLTPRLRELLIYLTSGMSRKEIARQMQLSQHTVSDYCKSLFRQLGVSGRGQLLAKFIGPSGVR
jgi:DNA-binding CsgD family transcriptional regulator